MSPGSSQMKSGSPQEQPGASQEPIPLCMRRCRTWCSGNTPPGSPRAASPRWQSYHNELVALRKSIDAERRRSRQELDKARKDGDRTRRETSKWKREAARMKAMADDAKKMSRLRLEEANRTRGKYREAERR